MTAVLERVKSLLQAEAVEEARELLESLQAASIRDGDFHLLCADFWQSQGEPAQLAESLNLAYRDRPHDHAILKRIAQLRLDEGELEKAARCLRTLVERCPEDVEARRELAAVLQDLQRGEEAIEVYQQGLELSSDASLEASLRAVKNGRTSGLGEDDEGAVIPADVIMKFVTLFDGREGYYARQWSDSKRGGYSPIRLPFDYRVAERHLCGAETVGIYLVRSDNMVGFAAIDLDLNRAFVNRYERDSPEWNEAMEGLHRHAVGLSQIATRLGVANYLEDSGGKGRHIWCFFERKMLAKSARNFVKLWVRLGGKAPASVNVEVFPKQTKVDPQGLGNLIKLPLGLHRGTSRLAVFLSPEGGPVEDQFGFVRRIQRNERSAIQEFQRRALDEVDLQDEAEEGEGEEGEGAESEGRGGRVRLPQLTWEDYRPEQDLEYQTLMLRCATLRAIRDQAEQNRQLSYDEMRVLRHSLGHLKDGAQAVNRLLAQCPDVPESLMMGSRLAGSPISCAKIRQAVPHITQRVDCDCQLSGYPGHYPSPVVHLLAPLQAEVVDEARLHAWVEDYVRALRCKAEAEERLRALGGPLEQFLLGRGLSELQTPAGLLRRDEEHPGMFKVS